jgi:hypothetical protein
LGYEFDEFTNNTVSYLSIAKKIEARIKQTDVNSEPSQVDPSEGRIIAVKICSHLLDACIWLTFDREFEPDDDEQLAVFYADEIPFLKNKTVQELKSIIKCKLTFGRGDRVQQ